MLPDCSQATIEVSVLGLDRSGDLSGAMAPEIWFSFLRSGKNQELFSICDHNIKDISGLASLFLAMQEIASNPIESRKRFRFNEEALALHWWKIVRRQAGFFEENAVFDCYMKTAMFLLEGATLNGSLQASLVLSKNAEWHLKDIKLALSYTELALDNREIPDIFREELEKRRIRLLNKLSIA
jgi:hypothetical protein